MRWMKHTVFRNRRNDWKRAETADILGIDRRTLFRKIKQFDLEDEEGK